MTYDEEISEVTRSMAEAPKSVQVEYRTDCLIREINELPMKERIQVIVCALDDLCAIANETPASVDRYAAGQIICRAQLIGSFLMERNHGHLKVISNGQA